ncbi:hypothetical protein [Microvirga puerhi]|uniref:Uncharacterized protein n=1 Tax=Microvirga puerhi TaxID=2876078 RepID=A0ABS7VIF2_9HYPH|nr:hypothetical protein [Microvirga puerhi]MBZ6075290.1 hypothetical protein [Microvirga puerhi]
MAEAGAKTPLGPTHYAGDKLEGHGGAGMARLQQQLAAPGMQQYELHANLQ